MRPIRMFMALSVAFVALAGCLDDDEPATESAEAPDMDVPELVEPRTEHFSCETAMGAAVVTTNNIGGCLLGAAAFTGTATNMTLPGGCNVEYDADGDDQADGDVTEGSVVEAAWELVVFCGPGSSGESMLDLVEILDDVEMETEDDTTA